MREVLLQAGYEWKDYDVETESQGDGGYYTLTAGLRYRVGERTTTGLPSARARSASAAPGSTSGRG